MDGSTRLTRALNKIFLALCAAVRGWRGCGGRWRGVRLTCRVKGDTGQGLERRGRQSAGAERLRCPATAEGVAALLREALPTGLSSASLRDSNYGGWRQCDGDDAPLPR